MRLFVAVDISDEAREAIADAQRRLKPRADGGSPMRWVKPEHLHLTLIFLGEVEDGRTPAVIEAMARPLPIAPFEMEFRGLGSFPPRGAPRALWIGVADGAAEIVAVQAELAERVVHLGMPVEQRPFSPHLTIARWKESRSADRTRLLDGIEATPMARVPVFRATLYRSQLSSAGPTYTPLAHATLAPPR